MIVTSINSFDSLGYIIKNTDNEKFLLFSKGYNQSYSCVPHMGRIKKIKDDTWKYLKFSFG